MPTILTVLAVQGGWLQDLLMTTNLTGGQRSICIGLALLVPLVVEVGKYVRRRRQPMEQVRLGVEAVAAEHARSGEMVH